MTKYISWAKLNERRAMFGRDDILVTPAAAKRALDAVLSEPPYSGQYKISDIFPDTYLAMTTTPDEVGDILFIDHIANDMFNECQSLANIPRMPDTHAVGSMSSMFFRCFELQNPPALDTSSCENMNFMFSSCHSLLRAPQMDTSNVITMKSMFTGCAALTQVPEIDTSSCRYFSSMFAGCSALAEVPQLNMASVTLANNVNQIFDYCPLIAAVTIKNASDAVKSYLTTTYPNITFTWTAE